MRKVVVFIGSRDADIVRDAIAGRSAGLLANYSESVSRAMVGEYGSLRALDERRIEFVCDDDTYHSIVEAIKTAVPPYAASIDSWSMETYAHAR